MEKQLLSSSKISTKLISYVILFGLLWFIIVSIISSNLALLFSSNGYRMQLILQALIFSVIYFAGFIFLWKLANILTFRNYSIEEKEKKTFFHTITTFILVLFVISLAYNYYSYANLNNSLTKKVETMYIDITNLSDSATQKQKEYVKKLKQEKDIELQSVESATSAYILVMCFCSILGYYFIYYFEKKSLQKII